VWGGNEAPDGHHPPKEEQMRKAPIGILFGILMTFALTLGASAASPHFSGTPTATVDSGGTLTVAFRATGLGNISTVDFTVTASGADATYQCYTKSGNAVNGVPKTSTVPGITETDSFPVRNGQTRGIITVDAPDPSSDLNCTGRQEARLVSATYYDVELTGPGGLFYDFGTVSS
jgi:hypothetical protein